MPAVTTKADLENIENDLTGTYWLTGDIDASGGDITPLGQAADFTGVLDGRGYTITDLTITVSGAGNQYVGLFKGNAGTVKNLTVEATISATSTGAGTARVGGIASGNSGTIRNCHTVVTLTAIADWYAEAAGIAGYNSGTIDGGCTAQGAATADGIYAYIGGLVHENAGTIQYSFANIDGNATGSTGSYAGGALYDNLSDGIVSCCYAIGDIVADAGNARASGFAYENNGAISDCFSRGNASAPTGSSKRAVSFIMYNDAGATIDDSYSTGAPTADTIAGLCYSNDGTITNSFWDTETSGTETSDGGTGKTTAEMKTRSTFTDADWDFIVIWCIAANTNDGYPFFYSLTDPADGPRPTTPIEDKVTLEAIRNLEMSARGRFRVDKEGNATYKSRYARNA